MTTIIFTLLLVDFFAFMCSGRQAHLKQRYMIPWVGGWMALHDRIKEIGK